MSVDTVPGLPAIPAAPRIMALRSDSWVSLDRTIMSKGLSSELSLKDKSVNDSIINIVDQSDDLHVPPTEKVRRARRGGTGWTAEEMAESIYDKNLSSASWIVDSSKAKDIPKFDISELKTGRILGSGCFGSVWEIQDFELHGEKNEASNPRLRWRKQKKEESTKDIEVDPGEIESRNFIAKHCYRKNGDARYALKRLKPKTVEDEVGFINGMNDLANETLFLSSLLNHPNVIKLRGIAMESMFSKDYFLILDRLYDTLHVRILKWKKKRKRVNARFVGPVFKDRRRALKEQMLEEQMQYGMDLVAAIAYIHEHRIMHRDLKPDNIGFDVRDDIKVFDFGLAKELPPAKTNSPHETYHFTPGGSPRYMAPEVALNEPYNQACDIYSFGLVFWEMLAMHRPYPTQTSVALLEENVWSPSGPQMRPPMSPKTMALNVQKMLHQSWHPNPAFRPRAPQLLNSLKQECLKIRASMRVSHSSRRSTFVFGREDSSKEITSNDKQRDTFYTTSDYSNYDESYYLGGDDDDHDDDDDNDDDNDNDHDDDSENSW